MSGWRIFRRLPRQWVGSDQAANANRRKRARRPCWLPGSSRKNQRGEALVLGLDFGLVALVLHLGGGWHCLYGSNLDHCGRSFISRSGCRLSGCRRSRCHRWGGRRGGHCRRGGRYRRLPGGCGAAALGIGRVTRQGNQNGCEKKLLFHSLERLSETVRPA